MPATARSDEAAFRIRIVVMAEFLSETQPGSRAERRGSSRNLRNSVRIEPRTAATDGLPRARARSGGGGGAGADDQLGRDRLVYPSVSSRLDLAQEEIEAAPAHLGEVLPDRRERRAEEFPL